MATNADESTINPAEAQTEASAYGTSPVEHARRTPETDRIFGRVLAAIVCGFWSVAFVTLSIDRYFTASDSWQTIQVRGIVTLFAIGFTFLIAHMLRRAAGGSFLARVLWALGLALVASCLHAAVFWAIYTLILGPPPTDDISFRAMLGNVPLAAPYYFWIYASVTAAVLALMYGQESLDRKHQIVDLAAQADRARLQAMRFQLNPHFLFNALNSVASLISSQRNADAETVVENLSEFLRSTLKLGPGKEISLAQELGLQAHYLEVEKIRFPDRLRVSTDVPAELRDVLVPNLISQPLIENAVKHAVARSDEPVHLLIQAREKGGTLFLEIRDDGGNAEPVPGAGTSVGLDNVARRLRLHYGTAATFQAVALREGGFAVRLSLPARRAKCPTFE